MRSRGRVGLMEEGSRPPEESWIDSNTDTADGDLPKVTFSGHCSKACISKHLVSYLLEASTHRQTACRVYPRRRDCLVLSYSLRGINHRKVCALDCSAEYRGPTYLPRPTDARPRSHSGHEHAAEDRGARSNTSNQEGRAIKKVPRLTRRP